jgi:hypothetical protein
MVPVAPGVSRVRGTGVPTRAGAAGLGAAGLGYRVVAGGCAGHATVLAHGKR